jgi:hypothetical protein
MTAGAVISWRTSSLSISHVHFRTPSLGDSSSSPTDCNTFASMAACAPSGDVAIRYNACVALSIILRLPPLNRNQHLVQERMIETHRKRDMRGLQGFIPKTAGAVNSWRTSSPSMSHVHFRTSSLGDSSSSPTHCNTFAFTAACAPSDNVAIRYNVFVALSITLRFPPLHKTQHLVQEDMIETHCKRETSGWQRISPKTAGAVASWRTRSPSMSHVHFWTSSLGESSSSLTHCNTFASTAACAPSGDVAIRYNVCIALSIILRFPPLNRNQHLVQERMIETHRKRDTSCPTVALALVSWRASSSSIYHVHFQTSSLGDSSSLATHCSTFASTAACAPSGDETIRYNVFAALLITLRFS